MVSRLAIAVRDEHRLLRWSRRNLRDYLWRSTTDPYSILVAEFLLQRTDADTVVPIYEAFLTRYPSLDNLAIAPIEEIAELLRPLGLFFRAERLSQTANIIAKEYEGEIPQEETELLKLPGIGKYTARALLSQAFDKPASVLDTNVARILERFFGIKGGRVHSCPALIRRRVRVHFVKSRCKTLWNAADTIAPDTNVGYWNLTLLDFGALVCTARSPKCHECFVSSRCSWFNLN